MGKYKRSQEIALQRNPAYNSDPEVPWTLADWEKVVTVFGKLSEPNFLTEESSQGF